MKSSLTRLLLPVVAVGLLALAPARLFAQAGGTAGTTTGGSTGPTAGSQTTTSSGFTGSSSSGTKSTGTTSTSSIARPVYPPSNTTGVGGAGNVGGGFGSAGFGSVGGSTNYRGPSASFTTYGTYRAPSYITALDESIPIVTHAAPELQ